MASKLFIFIVVAGCCLALSEAIPKLKINEKQLRKIKFQVADQNDSGEDVTARNKEKKRCSCPTSLTCSCCLKPRILGKKYPGCINMTVIPEGDVVEKVEVSLNALGKSLANHVFELKKLERVCDRLPGGLDKFKFCLFTKNTYTDDDGLVSCPTVEVIMGKTPFVILTFKCVQFLDERLQFSNHVKVDEGSMFNVKFKNPFDFFGK